MPLKRLPESSPPRFKRSFSEYSTSTIPNCIATPPRRSSPSTSSEAAGSRRSSTLSSENDRWELVPHSDEESTINDEAPGGEGDLNDTHPHTVTDEMNGTAPAKTEAQPQTPPPGPATEAVNYHPRFSGEGDVVIKAGIDSPIHFKANYNVLVASSSWLKTRLPKPQANTAPPVFHIGTTPEDLVLLLHFLHEVDGQCQLPPLQASLEDWVSLYWLLSIFGSPAYLIPILTKRASEAALKRISDLGDCPHQDDVLDVLAAAIVFKLGLVFATVFSRKFRREGWSIVDNITHVNGHSLAARHKTVYEVLLALERASLHFQVAKSQIKVKLDFETSVFLMYDGQQIQVATDGKNAQLKLWNDDRRKGLVGRKN